ncbi:MFS general substrate transporter [Westerdykella ornata]|uniref:MFS general substrate transporter n=1 Tax=Westerdykella ornata TaxID=318751 RepID=A0A6A6JI30_WESOR|nr:MFS general substrate transporter [Westerdykella ornata]KAF2274909.1 MFS general substrate transporter [Westerdykella ornata]
MPFLPGLNSRKPEGPRSQSGTASVDKGNAGTLRKWHLGILSDPYTDEVPGSVILLSKATKRNEPLGLQHAHARHSASSLPSPYPRPRSASRGSHASSRSRVPEKKKTKDGRFILEPQPDDSANDPLNWPRMRRDFALVSLGFYCMVGGGMTPVLAAGFKDVAKTYGVSVPQVALTTGLYMLGLGLGSVLASPTAILWGKRPVYLAAIILFSLSAVWCALSPNYPSLVVARIVQGLAVSPVECLPSASIAEIFFLHERAYRLGIYTLLLLGGKNLIPLVSAAIINSLGWRWVFWVVAIVVGFCFFLIFFCVPETFWDRTPRPRDRSRARTRSKSPKSHHHRYHLPSFRRPENASPSPAGEILGDTSAPLSPNTDTDATPRAPRMHRVGFVEPQSLDSPPVRPAASPAGIATPLSTSSVRDYFDPMTNPSTSPTPGAESGQTDVEKQLPSPSNGPNPEFRSTQESDAEKASIDQLSIQYTDYYRAAPPKSYIQSLKLWNGRLAKDKWLHVAIRPFILFAYPAVLWSSMVYALAVGWLIVLSESLAHIYQTSDSYNFTSLQVGLVYISPFVGGILGTAVAGKISDLVVRFMARRNDGVYEPEFRLVMAIPIALSTTIGLMGFGWSAEEKNNWIVPTVFFGVISFGCSLASTTAVTFVVDSYRVYAGEALVTLNFCKNVLHGFIFSLFFPHWLESSGSKSTFLAIGGIQMGCMLFSIPMYIYGKRARMWTVRKNLMEKF